MTRVLTTSLFLTALTAICGAEAKAIAQSDSSVEARVLAAKYAKAHSVLHIRAGSLWDVFVGRTVIDIDFVNVEHTFTARISSRDQGSLSFVDSGVGVSRPQQCRSQRAPPLHS